MPITANAFMFFECVKSDHEANFSRRYNCEGLNIEGSDRLDYSCEPMHFVDLGSVPHKYYLINFRLPMFIEENGNHTLVNQNIGRIEHMNMPGTEG